MSTSARPGSPLACVWADVHISSGSLLLDSHRDGDHACFICYFLGGPHNRFWDFQRYFCFFWGTSHSLFLLRVLGDLSIALGVLFDMVLECFKRVLCVLVVFLRASQAVLICLMCCACVSRVVFGVWLICWGPLRRF